MRTAATPPIQAAIPHLLDLPFVDEVELRPRKVGGPAEPKAGAPHGLLAIQAGRKRHVFRLEIVARRWDPILLDHLRNTAAHQAKRPLMVMAQRIPRQARERLRNDGIAYVDAAGNCFVKLGADHLAWIEGRKPLEGQAQTPARRGLGAAGYRIEFALLADPELLTRPTREIATAAGVGKTVVAELLQRHLDQGPIVEQGGQRRLVDRPRLLDDWLGGYERILRPRLLLGEFEAADAGDPERLQARLQAALAPRDRWAFGGGIAAKHWTGHWRGDLTVLHVGHAADDLPRRLGLLPARRGRIKLLRNPFGAALDEKEHLAHPLLVYAELMLERLERAREAALEVRRHFPDIFA